MINSNLKISIFYRPIIATSSGQFHFEDEEHDSISKRENSLNFWWFGNMKIEKEDS